tara:strand:- start:165 stop:296 length:132 start_codon:yes stop_codon:yes gene_type:complete
MIELNFLIYCNNKKLFFSKKAGDIVEIVKQLNWLFYRKMLGTL